MVNSQKHAKNKVKKIKVTKVIKPILMDDISKDKLKLTVSSDRYSLSIQQFFTNLQI